MFWSVNQFEVKWQLQNKTKYSRKSEDANVLLTIFQKCRIPIVTQDKRQFRKKQKCLYMKLKTATIIKSRPKKYCSFPRKSK